MTEVPGREEIMMAMKMREAVLLEDGTRLKYIRKACEVKAGVIEIVQKIFERRADRL